ncbi:MAG: methyltransferase [Proteobacteria bacterium]|nr:methyltransferase [Pseudomonadota bacterium]
MRLFEQKNGIRLDDEVHFIRSWMRKPLAIGAGTGPVTEALVAKGIDPARLVLVEFNPIFCRLLRDRYPQATVIQGDAYRLGRLLGTLLRDPAAAVVSGLPLVTKPLKMRLRLIEDAFHLMAPLAPFIQFTYAVVSPIPRNLTGIRAAASEPVWMNLPPARVWVYRKD